MGDSAARHPRGGPSNRSASTRERKGEDRKSETQSVARGAMFTFFEGPDIAVVSASAKTRVNDTIIPQGKGRTQTRGWYKIRFGKG